MLLRRKARYQEALKAFDPFKGELLMKVIDPLPCADQVTRKERLLRCLRLLLLSFLLLVPFLISLMPCHLALGGSSLENGLLITTPLYVAYGTSFLIEICLLILGRRLIGALIIELVESGVAGRSLLKFTPQSGAKGAFLRFAEYVTRGDFKRTIVWLVLLALHQVNIYRVFLSHAQRSFVSVPAKPGSFFYFLHVNGSQPNLCGIWSVLITYAVVGYALVLVARLMIVFACLCRFIADDPDLSVMPAHPDRTGGLISVGKFSLFLSLFIFVIGAGMAVMTVRDVISGSPYNVKVLDLSLGWDLLIMWPAYLFLGSLFCLLPMWPLRARMAEAKRAYLVQINKVYATLDLHNRASLESRKPSSENLEAQASMAALMDAANEMSTWPFDRKTFVRFASVLLAPIAPLLVDRIPHILSWLRSYLSTP